LKLPLNGVSKTDFLGKIEFSKMALFGALESGNYKSKKQRIFHSLKGLNLKA